MRESSTRSASYGVEAVLQRPRRNPAIEFLKRLLLTKPLGAIGLVLVVVLVLVAIFANVIAPYGINETNLADRLQSPNFKHWFGTDDIGRDLFSRVIMGSRISVYVGIGAVGISIVTSTLLGMGSGYFAGKLDLILQRVVDAWMAFPGLIILLAIMGILGPGLLNVIFALALSYTFARSRVMRSATLAIKEQQYIEGARAIGCDNTRILRRHVLPNIIAPIIIIGTNSLGQVILSEASISFLGFGIPPPMPSWGGMLSGVGRTYMELAPWLAIFPGLALSLVVFGWNMLGDALRDLLDPRLRGSR